MIKFLVRLSQAQVNVQGKLLVYISKQSNGVLKNKTIKWSIKPFFVDYIDNYQHIQNNAEAKFFARFWWFRVCYRDNFILFKTALNIVLYW